MRLPWRTKTDILVAQIEFLQAQVAQLQNYVLMVTPTQAAQFVQGPPTEKLQSWPESGLKLYSTEEEEDLEYALSEGDISPEEYARKINEIYEDSIEN